MLKRIAQAWSSGNLDGAIENCPATHVEGVSSSYGQEKLSDRRRFRRRHDGGLHRIAAPASDRRDIPKEGIIIIDATAPLARVVDEILRLSGTI
jgi:hypothetical protein